MQFLYKYSKKYGKQFWTAVFFVTMEAFCDLLQPTIMARVIDVGVAGRRMDTVFEMGGLMLLVTAAGAVAAAGRNIISSQVSQRIGAELRSDLYQTIQGMPFSVLDKLDKASLVTRLTNDVTQVQAFVNSLMRISLKAPLLCIGGLIMAVSLNARLAVVLAVIVPVIILLIGMNMKIGFPLFFRVQTALDQVNGVMREYLSGVRVVKAFNRFADEQKKFAQANDRLQADTVTAMRVMAVFGPGVILTLNLGVIAVLWLGGLGVGSGQIQVGQVVAFINYMMQILYSLMIISLVFNLFVRARASADRIGEVLLRDGGPAEAVRAAAAGLASGGQVEFYDVGFSYEKDGEPVLRNIDLSCKSGEMMGIVGSTGAGKSTLVKLIPRFYDPDSGSVKINGQDIKTVAPQHLRDKIAIVPQNTVLFTGTVLDNIRWGKKTADFAEITAAAQIAEAHGFIMELADGYQTRLGQNGVNLSGGQKQRIAIARALLRIPEILVLDDCTSAVDAATEAKIKQSIRQYADGCTRIIIAQRITAVMDADIIAVLDKGRIVGRGTHSELLAACSIYRELWESQLGMEVKRHG
ncbi:ABC transporter ATP-binding protein|uniref:ATP-binding cassette, subfamily B n=1 Tax=Dendrosporobacter quercicolus TaxID=146817 RepID=A0A1G9XIU1_9FIRM|nr:ABC transporter ATP-binding protein [Dendrosporobacter quercicolus]NSL49664.1 ABC transporter ATP-binding protein [Dendrosporobacter quercicolus DSM 1736]SDM96155.1 ATP-binding cassette, subfamily B [Dendrosporobacter quercicolus]